MSEIRSYRRVFDLERRIYSVDRFRLNPNGIPLRGIAYAAGAAGVGLLAGGLPLFGLIPWYLRDLALPACVAAALAMVRIDGRPFHHAAWAGLRLKLGPGRVVRLNARSAVGRSWRPADLLVLPDGSDAALRALRYSGPGAVLVRVEHGLLERTAHRRLWPPRRAATVAVWQLGKNARLARGRVFALGTGCVLSAGRRPRRRR